MARPRLIILLLIACTGLFPAQAGEVRVVSQTVGSDELLLAVAAPEQIAALSHLSRDPVFSGVAREAAAFPAIGHGDAETILRFRPTLVIFSDYSREELVEQIRRAGVPVLIISRYQTLEDAFTNLRQIAAALGDEAARARAEAVIADYRARLDRLRQRLRGVTPVRVIAPSTYGVIPGAATTFQDICAEAGAENLAATLGGLTGHAMPPGERMLKWPVEVVVLGGSVCSGARNLSPARRRTPYRAAAHTAPAAMLEAWALGCVTHLRVHAYEQLARQLHPDRFREEAP